MHPAFFIILLLFALSFAQEAQEQSQRADLLGTVQVSKVHSQDEAKGSYKSPRRALFMSLLLPGTGQLYVGGKQSRYIRGVFYLAEEIALISGLYYHSIHRYDKQVKRYQDFAKNHFSVSRYEEAMNGIYTPQDEDNFRKLYGQERENYCKVFLLSLGPQPCIENFGKNFGNYPGDNTPLYNSSEYYSIIANGNFVPGWGDSGQFNEYISMRKKASNLADRQAIFLGAIILNHIVSAIDAALSANAHNSSLYEEKLSFLDNIRLNSDFSVSENFRAETAVVYVF